eukprot:GHVT01098151.1.p1 GENE.GHVT01098151.1~~GHVT01098151.1.p1  ORF type:complete len:327 (-),score=14.19 GHVT01098151.1:970-1950(-)
MKGLSPSTLLRLSLEVDRMYNPPFAFDYPLKHEDIAPGLIAPPTLETAGAVLAVDPPVHSRLRDKATVLLLGSPGSGKSTFVEWLMKDALPHHGANAAVSLGNVIGGGDSSLQLNKQEDFVYVFPFLRDVLPKHSEAVAALSAALVGTDDPILRLLTVIEAPPIRDDYPMGSISIHYGQFAVDLAEHSDVILVFFDDIPSQSLVDVVRRVQGPASRIKFVFTKLDRRRSEEEYLRITCAAAQAFRKATGCHHVDIFPICIPGAVDGTHIFRCNSDILLETPGSKQNLSDIVRFNPCNPGTKPTVQLSYDAYCLKRILRFGTKLQMI